MPLDDATLRFAQLRQPDLDRLAGDERARAARGETLRYDSVSRVAVFQTALGLVTSRLHGEVLATYSADDRMLRWAWAGRSTSASAIHGDLVFREGQSRGIPQLAVSVVGDLDPAEALALARLGALVAGAEAVHVRANGNPVEYVGLFERARPAGEPGAGRYSIPPPPVDLASEPDPSVARRRSQPPGVRPPPRELFLPLANSVLGALARRPEGYKQALFVLLVDAALEGRPRIVVQLVIVDATGLLRSLDPTQEVVAAASELVREERRSGGVTWRKLSARVAPKPDGGARFDVEVV